MSTDNVDVGSTEKNDRSIGRLSHTHQSHVVSHAYHVTSGGCGLMFAVSANQCNTNSPVAGIISAKCENKYCVQYVFDRAWTSYFWWK